MFGVARRMEQEKRSVESTVQRADRFVRRENRTGIPMQLKERLENSTGMSFDDVRVHYNSDLPARLDALAYTQGNQVEIGPGQERHLPHELGHVVQQKLGAVRANTVHSSGVALNTDAHLEHQADEIGAGKQVAIVQRMRHNVVQRCGTAPPGAGTGGAGGSAASNTMSLAALPQNVQDSYTAYNNDGWHGVLPSQTPGTRAGGPWYNRGTPLPPTDAAGNRITYREFDVNSLQYDAVGRSMGRDAERFLVGSDGSVWYTDSHYGDGPSIHGYPNFVRII